MLKRPLITLAVVLLAALIVGCAARKTTAWPLVSVSPTPKTLSLAEAAAKYLKIVAPSTAAQDRLTAEVNEVTGKATANFASVHAAARATITVDRAFIAELKGTRWPAQIRGDIVSVEKETTTSIAPLTELVNADTIADYDAAVDRLSKLDTEATQLLRVRLGLPAAP